MAFVKVKESARQSDDGYKSQKPDHFSLVVEKNEVAKSEYNRPTASPRWTRTKAMSDTGEAIGFAYLRNGTRLLSLMSRMRVRSGPGCGASGVRRSPPVGAECSSAVAALHVCVSVDGGVLDVSQPNQLLIAAGMGANAQRTPRGILPSRRRHRRRVGRRYRPRRRPEDVASIEIEPDLAPPLYCCEHGGAHFVLAYRLYEWKKAIGRPGRDRREARGTRRPRRQLTPHAVALVAVAVVNETIDKMGSNGSRPSIAPSRRPARSIRA